MKKIFLPLIIFSNFNLSFAQYERNPLNENYKLDNNPVITEPKKGERPYSSLEAQKLNILLEEQNYAEFYNYIFNLPVSETSYINYLISKSSEGHPPIYWLMANYYANKNMPLETHKWYYIAIITTQQDASLCYDASAIYVSYELNKKFSNIITLTRKTPEKIRPSMGEVKFFIDNLKKRPNPAWTCAFGDNYKEGSNRLVIPNSQWQYKRELIYKKFITNLEK